MFKTKNNSHHALSKALKREAKEADGHKQKLNFSPHGPTLESEMKLYDEAIFEWVAPEYIQHPKGRNWYIAEAVIVALFLLGTVLTANYTMALAIVTFVAVYHYLHEKHPPKEIKITISRQGIKVGDMIFPYTHIQAFWIMYHPPHVKTLNLRVSKRFYSDVVIQLNDEDPAEIRQFLCGQIPEWEGKTERFTDTVLRLLKL